MRYDYSVVSHYRSIGPLHCGHDLHVLMSQGASLVVLVYFLLCICCVRSVFVARNIMVVYHNSKHTSHYTVYCYERSILAPMALGHTYGT